LYKTGLTKYSAVCSHII